MKLQVTFGVFVLSAFIPSTQRAATAQVAKAELLSVALCTGESGQNLLSLGKTDTGPEKTDWTSRFVKLELKAFPINNESGVYGEPSSLWRATAEYPPMIMPLPVYKGKVSCEIAGKQAHLAIFADLGLDVSLKVYAIPMDPPRKIPASSEADSPESWDRVLQTKDEPISTFEQAHVFRNCEDFALIEEPQGLLIRMLDDGPLCTLKYIRLDLMTKKWSRFIIRQEPPTDRSAEANQIPSCAGRAAGRNTRFWVYFARA